MEDNSSICQHIMRPGQHWPEKTAGHVNLDVMVSPCSWNVLKRLVLTRVRSDSDVKSSDSFIPKKVASEKRVDNVMPSLDSTLQSDREHFDVHVTSSHSERSS